MKKILASILASFIVAFAFSFPVFAQDETDGDDFITPPPIEDEPENDEEGQLISPLFVNGAEGDNV